jgi:hypothetical protein
MVTVSFDKVVSTTVTTMASPEFLASMETTCRTMSLVSYARHAHARVCGDQVGLHGHVVLQHPLTSATTACLVTGESGTPMYRSRIEPQRGCTGSVPYGPKRQGDILLDLVRTGKQHVRTTVGNQVPVDQRDGLHARLPQSHIFAALSR